MADVFECPIATVTNKEGAALGAAILAGVGAGVFDSIPAACDSVLQTNEPQLPDQAKKASYEGFSAIYHGLYNDLKESFKALGGV